ncbi:Uma2 family endonuclease [Leptolyngbya cf. ectocarpi LEGE 11479]|uniref:Uma2 family endonuclease n=1 Tax=Leptolyngbya cf. ectocarpi LEGE 11479 TaxID=1828722 RepID=A0A929FCV5_LEPEC|nr:Uma2 family endonuclease [Leptolyngbya ectocarpi]MBE9070462.1 Uma2 family endonuclease [Leptolyngbya cf. ectocarpi LEGE 11479]
MTIAQNPATPQTTPRVMTLEEYLNYDDGTDTRYELADGILVVMPAEHSLNNTIALFLVVYFATHLGISHRLFATGHQIQVPSERVSARQPDLIVHSEASATAILADGKLLRLGQPAPHLVVEVVSSSDTDKKSRDRDYVEKRREYAQRGIPEYWIIDPIAAMVQILVLVDGVYQEHTFVGAAQLVSAGFSELTLTAEQVLNAGLEVPERI